MPKERKSRILRPVSLRLLAGLIVVSLSAAYYLLPSHRKLLDRQLQDGKNRQALFTLKGMPASEREKDSAFYAILELRLTREILDPADSAGVIRQLLEACHAYEQFGFRDEFLREILPLIPFTQEVERVQKLLNPALARMPPNGKQQIFLYLANAALAANKPLLAPTLYLKFWETSNPLDETTIVMARLWRSAGQAQRALDAIEAFLGKAKLNVAALSPTLGRLRIDLFRETAQPGKAFEALRDQLQLAATPADAGQFELLVTTALESGRTKEVLPIVQARAEEFPENVAIWKQLGDLSVSAGENELGITAFEKVAALEPENAAHPMKLGQLCEWTAQPNRAFDFYLKALELKETSGIERLASLSQGLYRDAELSNALDKLGDLVDPRNYPLQFARLYGRIGDFAKSKQLYTELLQAPGAGVELLVEYGSFLHVLSEFAPAYEAFTKASALKPDDPEILRPLAEIQFRMGDYQASLRDYGTLLETSTELDVFENYFNLAESLGDLDGIIRGLRIKTDRGISVSPFDYERLAAFINIKGDRAGYLRTLEASLLRYPDQVNLRETTAYAYSDGGDYARAIRHLEKHPNLRTNSRLVRFYASVLVQLKEFEKAEAFFTSGLDPEMLDTPLILEIRAYLYEAAGRIQDSTDLYSRLHDKDPGNARYALNYGRLLTSLGRTKEAQKLIQPFLDAATPETLRLAAQILSAVGDYRLAESYQRRFLATPPQPFERPQAWGYLGDLLAVQGDKRNAQKAYRRSLTEMFQSDSNFIQ